MRTLDTTVLNGLPVTIAYTIGRPEPDIGIMSSYVDDWYITRVCGKKKSNSFIDALHNRITQKDEEARIIAEIMENDDE